MAALLTQYIDGYIVNVHAAESPTDEEWDVPIQMAREFGRSSLGTLIWTAGGGPSYKQRQRMVDLMKTVGVKPPPSAIMHYDSRVVKTIITVWSTVTNTQLKSFGIDAFDAAFDYLKTPAESRPRIQAAIAESRKTLGV